jgi:hypothetical protein
MTRRARGHCESDNDHFQLFYCLLFSNSFKWVKLRVHTHSIRPEGKLENVTQTVVVLDVTPIVVSYL